MMEEQFFIFGSYVESIYGNSEINRYQQWLENNGSEKNKALILYLRAVWEVAKDEYDLFNETALKYARESLECDKDIPAVYHIIGRLTSPVTSEYENIKKDFNKLLIQILKNPLFTWRQKVAFLLFWISPNIYGKIIKFD